MSTDYAAAAGRALRVIGRDAEIYEIWQEIEKEGVLEHGSIEPKQTLRNEMRKTCEGANHKSSYLPYIFTNPSRGFYGLIEWKDSSNNIQFQRDTDIKRLLPKVKQDMKSWEYEEEKFEGEKVGRYSNHYERNPKLRAEAIAIHGTTCMVEACSFNFQKVYGLRGKDFIEVHHLKPLSKLNLDFLQPTNPQTDLVVICSNCHRMIHRQQNKILSLKEVSDLITNLTSKST